MREAAPTATAPFATDPLLLPPMPPPPSAGSRCLARTLARLDLSIRASCSCVMGPPGPGMLLLMNAGYWASPETPPQSKSMNLTSTGPAVGWLVVIWWVG